MHVLDTLFGNPFDTNTISDSRLAEFTRDHLQRLTQASVGNRYQALIAETKAAYDACFGTMVAEDVASSERGGLTQSTQSALKAFQEAVADQLEAAVRLAFGKSSPEYASFFPQGLTEYRQATLTTAPALMERVVTLITTHQTALSAAQLTRFTQLRTAFQSARQSQQEKKGQVSELKAASKALRHALELRLWKNALVLATEHLNQPEQARVFFDAGLLTLPRRKKPEASDLPPHA